MKISVPIQFVPDLVEELVIDESGRSLDLDEIRWTLNEFDDHAIEQAILLKEKYGAKVTVLAPDFGETEDVLYAAAAKGADQLIKIAADFGNGVNNHTLARLFAPLMESEKPDLVLTGVQDHNNLDGSLGPILAEYMGMPYMGYISGVTIDSDKAVVRKEYPDGLIAEMEVTLPAVLGIQASETAPRYVPFIKIHQAMKTRKIDEVSADLNPEGALSVDQMFQPEVGEQAEMIAGDIEAIAARIASILSEIGVL